MSPTIQVSALVKSFRRTGSRHPGVFAAINHFFRPSWEDAFALKGISLAIERGERVAFLGPNGAGKSTTIKILSGILRQTSGSVSVLGLRPVEDIGGSSAIGSAVSLAIARSFGTTFLRSIRFGYGRRYILLKQQSSREGLLI